MRLAHTRELLISEGMRTMPSCLRLELGPGQPFVEGLERRIAELDLVVLSSFVSRLLGHLRIVELLKQRLPALVSYVTEARLLLHAKYLT
jgi:hypothetical protein